MTTSAVHLDPSRTPGERADALLAQMTIDERLAQLGSFWAFEILTDRALDPSKADRLLVHGIGQVTRAHGASDLPPRDAAHLANEIQRHLREHTRLGIPALVHEESLHGILGRGRTTFPQSLGLAATWRPDLVERMGSTIGQQLRAGGAHQALAPVLDVSREPRWGRIEETYGEDTLLVTAMSVAYVRGIQHGGRGPDGIVATAKHMVGHGVPEGGFNHAPVHIGQRELQDVFLPPFEAAVRLAGLRSVMHAYDDLDGVPCVASRQLLTTVLREGWGFDGIVVSDYAGIELLVRSHQVTADLSEAAVMALDAGVDVDLPSTRAFGDPLREALASGRVDGATIDQAVLRVLRLKFELGLFEQPYVELGAAEVGATQLRQDRELARELAQRSIVLARNDGILPLTGQGRIAVIGPSADDVRNLQGDYSYVAHVESLIEIRTRPHYAMLSVPPDLSTEGLLDGRVSVLEAIRARAGRDVPVEHGLGTGLMDGTDADLQAAIRMAADADVAILVVGERCGLLDDCQSGEARDRMDIGLPGRQRELVLAVAATGTPVVLVVVSGRPLAIAEEAAVVSAVLYAWAPGDEGGPAIADILFGDAVPGGRLPVTVPRSVGQVPTYYGHKPSGGHSNWKGAYVDGPNTPLFPFGHGLSYTTFELGEPTLERDTISVDGELVARIAVRNTGTRAGDEVVQVYQRDLEASLTRPVRQLVGFARVPLEPGEARVVEVRLPADLLAFSGVDGRLRVEPGRHELHVGRSAEDIVHIVPFDVTGPVRVLERRRHFLPDVAIA